MALVRKRNTGIVLRGHRHTTDRKTFTRTRTEIWEGPFSALLSRQTGAARNAIATSLAPTEAGQGTLEITYEETMPASDRGDGGGPPGSGNLTTIEVEWVELRLRLEEHPRYTGLSTTLRQAIRKALDEADPSPEIEDLALELFSKLLRGQDSYSMAVPVVRRTSHRPSSLGIGGAWFRDNPPAGPSGWQYLKTADRITRTGTDYIRVEEWTGAKTWDPDIYE